MSYTSTNPRSPEFANVIMAGTGMDCQEFTPSSSIYSTGFDLEKMKGFDEKEELGCLLIGTDPVARSAIAAE